MKGGKIGVTETVRYKKREKARGVSGAEKSGLQLGIPPGAGSPLLWRLYCPAEAAAMSQKSQRKALADLRFPCPHPRMSLSVGGVGQKMCISNKLSGAAWKARAGRVT